MVSFSFFADPRCIYDTDLLYRLQTNLAQYIEPESTIQFYYSFSLGSEDFYPILVSYLKKLKKNYPDKLIKIMFVKFKIEEENEQNGKEEPLETPSDVCDILQDICIVESRQVSIFCTPNSYPSARFKKIYRWLYRKANYAVCYFYDCLLPTIEYRCYVKLADKLNTIYITNPDTMNRIVLAGKGLSRKKWGEVFIASYLKKPISIIAQEQQCTGQSVRRTLMYARWEVIDSVRILPTDDKK